jgi:RNA polymerase-binding protein DksA
VTESVAKSSQKKPAVVAKKPVKAEKPAKVATKTTAAPAKPPAAPTPRPERLEKTDKSAPPAKVRREAPLAERAAANVGVPVAPVPTDGKPRKNQAGLSSKELEHYRELLLSKRRELVGDMSSMEREALRTGGGSNLSNLPIHMADMGTDNYEQEFTLGLVEKDRTLLREINRALGKIQDGTYGLCEATGKAIGKPRLEAQPWARHSIEYARKVEKNKGR